MQPVFKAFILATWAGLGGVAFAAGEELSDNTLVARAGSILSVKEEPVDRVLGFYHGAPVVLDVICSDVCPDYTVRIIHHPGQAQAICPNVGGEIISVNVPRGIAYTVEKFCVPRILVRQKLYIDRPFAR